MQTAVITQFPSSKRGRKPGSIAAGTKSPDLTDLHVGGKIRLRRTMLGMSQGVLAEQLGITFQQVQKYEKGTNRVSASRLQAISGILKVPVSWFFDQMPGAKQATSGDAPEKEVSDVTVFLSSAEGLTLNRYFLKIVDPKVRRTIVALVKSLADNGADNE